MSGAALTSELIRAARALLRWDQRKLAEASSISLPTVKRLEAKPGPPRRPYLHEISAKARLGNSRR